MSAVDSFGSTPVTTNFRQRVSIFVEMTVAEAINDPLIGSLNEADGVNTRAFAQLLQSATRVLATPQAMPTIFRSRGQKSIEGMPVGHDGTSDEIEIIGGLAPDCEERLQLNNRHSRF